MDPGRREPLGSMGDLSKVGEVGCAYRPTCRNSGEPK